MPFMIIAAYSENHTKPLQCVQSFINAETGGSI
jgi:hypothetical protein